MLRDGQHIATKSVIQPPSISELATSVVRVLNQLDPGALERIINEADTALPDANSVLPNLSRTSSLLRNTAVDMHGHGRALLDNFQTLLRNAAWVGPVLADTAPPIRLIGQDAQIIWWSVITDCFTMVHRNLKPISSISSTEFRGFWIITVVTSRCWVKRFFHTSKESPARC